MRNNLFGTNSADNARAMIESLIVKNEYIDANERRHNSFGTALAKFAQFADISVIGFNQSVEKKNCKSLVSSEPFTVRTVDFNNPHNCTYYKPCSFILNGLTYTAGSWKELYTKFLILLYTDNTYSETIKGLIGKSLYGHRIDFADKNLYFRRPIEVSTNFFAEGNLSAMEIIRHIKCLIELCAISNDNMVIKYSVQEKNNDPKVSANTSTGKDKQLSIPSVPEEAVAKTSTPVIHAKTATNSIIDESKLATVATFIPDTTKSFVLKNAVIEILSSDAPEITKYREHRNGISSKSLRELIKEYYGKTIGFFEISKLLMIDKAFKSIGRGCYILNEATLSQKAETEYSELATIETKKEESIEISDKQVYTEKTVDTASEHSLTIKSILEVIKENIGNLQYEDGFGAYEVKTLLSQKGVADVSEEQIEALMSACFELQQIEDGYYSLIDDESYGNYSAESIVVMENTPDNTADMDTTDNTDIQEISHSDADERQIVLRLNGNTVRAYDYSDALSKVCEFSINCKPFKMARITGQAIQIHGNNVFYRQAVPVDGYNKLSNGLQIITITTLLDLQTITTEIQKYCQIDDDMITIISR